MSAPALRARGLALAASCAFYGAAAAEPAVELSERERAIVLTLSPLAPPPADTTNRVAENRGRRSARPAFVRRHAAVGRRQSRVLDVP